LQIFDKKTAQVLLTALAFALILSFVFLAWRAILAFLFAMFFAYLLAAPVSRLQTWFHGSRTAAIGVVYLVFVAVLVLVFSLLGPPVVQETQKLAQQAPGWANRITSRQIAEEVGGRYGWTDATVKRVGDFLDEYRPQIINTTETFVVRAVRSVQNTWWLILVPILAIFLLRDGERIGQSIINGVEDYQNRQLVAAMVEQLNSMLGDFIRAQLLMSVLAMVVITLVLSVMRVPYAIALGPAAGALEFIPVVGPVVGGLAIVGVALLSGYHHVWWIVVFLIVWRGIQDYVTAPRIMSGTLELHPLAVLFGVLAGGEVAGVIGIFLSIPVMVTLRILWHTWQLSRNSSRAAASTQQSAISR
jgi:predicted PurR-regulated permease PerM